MLTQGPPSDPKCKLIISSFLTLSDLLGCLVCTRNAMSIILLLQIMGGWERWDVVRLNKGVGWGDWGWVSCYSLFFLVLVPLYFVVSGSQSLYLGDYNVMAVMSVSLSLVPLTRSY